jgi:hypothetical protein
MSEIILVACPAMLTKVRKKVLPSGNTIVYIPFLKYEKTLCRGDSFLQFCKGLPRLATRQ